MQSGAAVFVLFFSAYIVHRVYGECCRGWGKVQYSTVLLDGRHEASVNYCTVGIADPTGRAALTARIVIVLKANARTPFPSV